MFHKYVCIQAAAGSSGSGGPGDSGFRGDSSASGSGEQNCNTKQSFEYFLSLNTSLFSFPQDEKLTPQLVRPNPPNFGSDFASEYHSEVVIDRLQSVE